MNATTDSLHVGSRSWFFTGPSEAHSEFARTGDKDDQWVEVSSEFIFANTNARLIFFADVGNDECEFCNENTLSRTLSGFRFARSLGIE